MNARTLRRLMNLWPPLLFSGIRISCLSDDFREGEIVLREYRGNRNYAGVHFGGSLFAMTDPLYMVMLSRVLGPAYTVWDKAANIEFVKPGRGRVTARFALTQPDIDAIVEATKNGAKHLPQFTVEITNAAGELVARAVRTVYVRRKPV